MQAHAGAVLPPNPTPQPTATSPSPCPCITGRSPPEGWASQHRADDQLTAWQWAKAPWKAVQGAQARHDVHLIYLPTPVLRRLKTAATQGGAGRRQVIEG